MRDFGAHRHAEVLTARTFERHPTITVLSTAHDRRTDWLRAGQARERILLGVPYPRDRSNAARATCIEVMRRHL